MNLHVNLHENLSSAEQRSVGPNESSGKVSQSTEEENEAEKAKRRKASRDWVAMGEEEEEDLGEVVDLARSQDFTLGN